PLRGPLTGRWPGCQKVVFGICDRDSTRCELATSGMIDAMGLLFGAILRLFRARRSLLLENLALRQQLAALKRRHPRPRLAAFDKVFWVLARKFWSGWKQALIVVSPETVVRWHRSGFALYWRAISKAHRVVGRRRISKEVRDLRSEERRVGKECRSRVWTEHWK